MSDLIDKAFLHAKEHYALNDDFHSWKHVEDVMAQASKITDLLEKRRVMIDKEILLLAIVFHDANYHSAFTEREAYESHPEESVKIMKAFLLGEGYPIGKIAKVQIVMLDHSSPHRKRMGDAYFIEGKIIYDSDKSIFITDQEKFDKYFNKLYFNESKSLVPFKV